MKAGEYIWDTESELRTCCEASLKLDDGSICFTAGKKPIATAILGPNNKKIHVTIHINNFNELFNANKIPCPYQDPDTWICKFGPLKPHNKCKPHTFEHRPIDWHSNGFRPQDHRSSIRCMIAGPISSKEK